MMRNDTSKNPIRDHKDMAASLLISLFILVLENRTESMNATQHISTTIDSAMGTMDIGTRGPITATQRAMAIPLFLYEVIRMSVTR